MINVLSRCKQENWEHRHRHQYFEERENKKCVTTICSIFISVAKRQHFTVNSIRWMHKCAKRFGPRNFGRKTNECTLKSCHNKTSIKYFFCSHYSRHYSAAVALLSPSLTDLFYFEFLLLSLSLCWWQRTIIFPTATQTG